MVAVELGTKRVCTGCGSKFYDLGKMPVECPECDESFIPAVLLPSKEVRPSDSRSAGTRWQSTGGTKARKAPEVVNGDDETDDDNDEVAAVTDIDLGEESDDEAGGNDDDAVLRESDGDDEAGASAMVSGTSSGSKNGQT